MAATFIPILIPDATTYTVLARNTGMLHYFPDLTATCTATLPSPKAGMWFEFASSGVAADASNWVFDTGSNTNYFIGGLTHNNTTADEEAGTISGDGNSNSKLTVVTPAPGTRIRIESTNGTLWALSGSAVSATIPSFADQ